jgi:hypothetical protein
MLTKTQLNRRYYCPCTEEGVKCKESFRYPCNLRNHILKEHRYSKEAKQILIKRRKYSEKGLKTLKSKGWVGI